MNINLLTIEYIKVSMEFTKLVIDMRSSQIKYDNLFFKGMGNITEHIKEKDKNEDKVDQKLKELIQIAKDIRDVYDSTN
tara:strand:- start:2630 stop:2866 length:237 start_codon:yes stop_codon:yes gene_type:complete